LGLGLAMLGCASSQKKEEFKELTKLSLDSQEEARKLREDGNLNSAVAKYQESLRYNPSPSVHKELGDTLVELNRYEEARAQYKLALMKNPEMTETQEAMDQLEARIQLAQGSQPSLERPSASRRQAPVLPEGPSPADDLYREDRIFDEIAEIRPPETPVSSGVEEFDSSTPRGGSDADALMAEAGDLFNAPQGRAIEYPTPAVQERPVVRAKIQTPGERSHLGGGRGLLGSSGKPAIVTTVSEPSPPARDEPPQEPSAYQVALAREAPSSPPVPFGRPGERGLGSPRRLPENAPDTTLPAVTRPDSGAGPSFAQGAPSTSVAEPQFALDDEIEATRPPRDERGFFQRFLGSDEDEIQYPEPAPPETGALLEPSYPRKELDLTGFGKGRFTGRVEPELDLEICKRRYYEEGDLQGAIRCFSDKRLDFPEEPTLYYELGMLYREAGSYALARQNFELALRYDPDNATYEEAIALGDIELAREKRESGDLKAAREILVKTVQEYPNMVAAHRELGKVYIREALSQEQSVALGAPLTPQLEAYIKSNWEQAEIALRKTTDLDPSGYKDWYNLGYVIQKQDDDTKMGTAAAAYRKALEIQPDYIDAHYNLANALEAQDVQGAIRHYEKALALARNQPDGAGIDMVTKTLRDLGSLYYRTGETDKAADCLTEYIQYVPADAGIEEILDQITSVPADRS
jgi:tetratricopeptide (TPR) repeat protein